MKKNKTGQQKAARILSLITGILICIIAVLFLLCSEFLLFLVFGIIGILFLVAAKRLKKPSADSSSGKSSSPVTSRSQKNPQDSTDQASGSKITSCDTNQTNDSSAIDKSSEVSNSVVKSYRVTGMQFYIDNIMKLAVENPDFDMGKKELIDSGLTEERIWKYEFYERTAFLEPEPDNPTDKNAIKVIVGGEHVGYIKSGSCAHLLKIIREGRIVNVSCEMGGGQYKYVSEEYDDEKDKEVYTLERNDCPFFVHLSITEAQ